MLMDGRRSRAVRQHDAADRPAACSALHRAASGCAAITYSSGLSGLPCAQPDGTSNTLLRWPPLKVMLP